MSSLISACISFVLLRDKCSSIDLNFCSRYVPISFLQTFLASLHFCVYSESCRPLCFNSLLCSIGFIVASDIHSRFLFLFLAQWAIAAFLCPLLRDLNSRKTKNLKILVYSKTMKSVYRSLGKDIHFPEVVVF